MCEIVIFVFNEMKLKIWFRTFLVDMRVKLGEIPGAEFEIGKFKRNINGIDEIDQIDHALQEVIMKLEEQSYPALLVFRGGSRGG